MKKKFQHFRVCEIQYSLKKKSSSAEQIASNEIVNALHYSFIGKEKRFDGRALSVENSRSFIVTTSNEYSGNYRT